MGILKLLGELFKGGGHARRTEEHISRGNGRERRVIHSLPALRERTISDIRGIRVLASACSDERSRDSGEMPSDPIRRESRALIAAAKRVERPLLGLLSSAIESESKVSEILSSIYSLSQEERESLSAIEL